ncbi:GAF domain-containing protein [Tunicatimonas pelagia]|uniref:GAF domain-containing protein n=1 Tax=Tunicatimonas pelagia TaxID=931531 RepID=UPI002666FCCF|nr:GAF domain-containing protein [Tunicatimonas pelagia]WKN43153.1 GAF domain-containing protein [Tunicatimonas pelagia]
MAENLFIADNLTKEELYQTLLPQLKSLTQDESNIVANLANLAAALKHGLGFFWVGFYRVKNEELILGPFQGPVACTRIAFGKGVCGTAWKEKRTIVVPDVHQFPGHIACSSESQSEIVVPVIKDNKVAMILDVDSDQVQDFDEVDEKYLGELANYIATQLV